MAEAAESREIDTAKAGGETTAKKKAAKDPKKKPAARAKRAKVKASVRKRLVWVVFSSSLREEGRFPYAEKEAAEARAVELHEKNHRKYFVQPVKEVLGERGTAAVAEARAAAAGEPVDD